MAGAVVPRARVAQARYQPYVVRGRWVLVRVLRHRHIIPADRGQLPVDGVRKLEGQNVRTYYSSGFWSVSSSPVITSHLLAASGLSSMEMFEMEILARLGISAIE